jgi:hypothetical protein
MGNKDRFGHFVLGVSCSALMLLTACALTPADDADLAGNMVQTQVFSGYVPVASSVKLQVREWTNNCHGITTGCSCTPSTWRDIDTLAVSTKDDEVVVDECNQKWYPYSKPITLPNARNRWCFDGLRRSFYQEWRLSVAGVPLASFDDGRTCEPSQNCGTTVARECGNADGIIRINCFVHGGVCTENFP